MTLMLRQRPVPLPVPHDRTSTVDPHTDPLAYAPPPFRCRERTRTSKCIYGLRILNICQKTQILISSHPNKRGSRSVPSSNADRPISSPLWPPSLMGWINQPPRPCRENNHPPRRRKKRKLGLGEKRNRGEKYLSRSPSPTASRPRDPGRAKVADGPGHIGCNVQFFWPTQNTSCLSYLTFFSYLFCFEFTKIIVESKILTNIHLASYPTAAGVPVAVGARR
jgi:hypothetical protein